MTKNQDNKKKNVLSVTSAYMDNIARRFDRKFSNRKSMMFAAGRICSAIYEAVINDEHYYKFMLECDRKGDNSDVIPVAIRTENNSHFVKFAQFGTELTLIGTFRSRDWTDEYGKHHLEHYMEADCYDFSLDFIDDKFDKNIVILIGYICTDPMIKVTKKKRTITEYRLAVDNLNHETEYFPILAWGKRAVQIMRENKCGDKFIVVGRLQSRPYKKKSTGNSFVAYEVSSTFTIHVNEKNRDDKRGEKRNTLINNTVTGEAHSG